jgi:hypothetical protein
MNTVSQKVEHPWVLFSLFITFFASIGFLLIAYFNWPPKFNFDWIVGILVTTGTILCALNGFIRLFFTEPYLFEIIGEDIRIRDWGNFRSRVRTFPLRSVAEICCSSEGASYLKTKDGKIHYIDDVLMLKYKKIFELIEKNNNDIILRKV